MRFPLRILKLPKPPPEPKEDDQKPPDDPALRGLVIRAGVGALPAVWED